MKLIFIVTLQIIMFSTYKVAHSAPLCKNTMRLRVNALKSLLGQRNIKIRLKALSAIGRPVSHRQLMEDESTGQQEQKYLILLDGKYQSKKTLLRSGQTPVAFPGSIATHLINENYYTEAVALTYDEKIRTHIFITPQKDFYIPKEEISTSVFSFDDNLKNLSTVEEDLLVRPVYLGRSIDISNVDLTLKLASLQYVITGDTLIFSRFDTKSFAQEQGLSTWLMEILMARHSEITKQKVHLVEGNFKIFAKHFKRLSQEKHPPLSLARAETVDYFTKTMFDFSAKSDELFDAHSEQMRMKYAEFLLQAVKETPAYKMRKHLGFEISSEISFDLSAGLLAPEPYIKFEMSK